MKIPTTLCISAYDQSLVKGDIALDPTSAEPRKSFARHLQKRGLKPRDVISVEVHLHRYKDQSPWIGFFEGLNTFTDHASSHIGYVYVARKDARRAYGVKKITPKLLDDIKIQLLSRLDPISRSLKVEPWSRNAKGHLIRNGII